MKLLAIGAVAGALLGVAAAGGGLRLLQVAGPQAGPRIGAPAQPPVIERA